MVNHIDPEFITNGIRLATAPVFLLTAVASMIGTVAGRLSRIIDRGRIIEERYLSSQNPLEFDRVREELKHLQFRGRLANLSIGLLTLCAFLIGLTIILLFLGETTLLENGRASVWSFLAGVGMFLLALVCFMTETIIATQVLDFRTLRRD
jgi:hypothetical protein